MAGFVVNNNESARPLSCKRPHGFPAGAIPTVDFLLHHLAVAVKKMAVKTHDRRSFTPHAARPIRQERLEGGPFMLGVFTTHDSRLRFGGLNHDLAAELNFPLAIAMGRKADNLGSL
jgi:hypothetical protein